MVVWGFSGRDGKYERSLSKVLDGKVLTASMSSDIPMNAVEKAGSFPYAPNHTLYSAVLTTHTGAQHILKHTNSHTFRYYYTCENLPMIFFILCLFGPNLNL